jgi:hypothetical protein
VADVRTCALAAGTADMQAVLANGLDMLAPDIDQPYVVAGRGEQPAVDRSHCSSANDADLHPTSPIS